VVNDNKGLEGATNNNNFTNTSITSGSAFPPVNNKDFYFGTMNNPYDVIIYYLGGAVTAAKVATKSNAFLELSKIARTTQLDYSATSATGTKYGNSCNVQVAASITTNTLQCLVQTWITNMLLNPINFYNSLPSPSCSSSISSTLTATMVLKEFNTCSAKNENWVSGWICGMLALLYGTTPQNDTIYDSIFNASQIYAGTPYANDVVNNQVQWRDGYNNGKNPGNAFWSDQIFQPRLVASPVFPSQNLPLTLSSTLKTYTPPFVAGEEMSHAYVTMMFDLTKFGFSSGSMYDYVNIKTSKNSLLMFTRCSYNVFLPYTGSSFIGVFNNMTGTGASQTVKFLQTEFYNNINVPSGHGIVVLTLISSTNIILQRLVIPVSNPGYDYLNSTLTVEYNPLNSSSNLTNLSWVKTDCKLKSPSAPPSSIILNNFGYLKRTA
jgi:hypothetical protein